MAKPIKMPFSLRSPAGQGTVYEMGSRSLCKGEIFTGKDGVRIPIERDNFEGGEARPIVKYRDTLR